MANFPEIVLVSPPNSYYNRFTYKYGLACLQAWLKTAGVTSRQYVPRQNLPLRLIGEELLAWKAPVVGFSVFDANYYLVKMLAERLKQCNPKLVIVAGGPAATFSDAFILRDCPAIDLCVRGEGEVTLSRILAARKGGDFRAIPGITLRAGETLLRTAESPLLGEAEHSGSALDLIPSPYLSGFLSGTENIGVLTSRGCVYRCTFCNFAKMFQHRLRYHSLDRVLEELKFIAAAQKHHPGNLRVPVMVMDDHFAFNRERAFGLCEAIVKAKLGLKLYGEIRPDYADPHLLEALKAAGFIKLNFGLESSDPLVLRTIKKVECREDLKALEVERNYVQKLQTAVANCKKIGIQPNVSVIFGLPRDTRDKGLKTLHTIDSLNLEYYYHNRLQIFSGTELAKTYHRYGLKLEPGVDGLPLKVKHRYDVTKIPVRPNSDVFYFYYKDYRFFTDVILGGEAKFYLVPEQGKYLIFKDCMDFAAQDVAQTLDSVAGVGLPIYFITSTRHQARYRTKVMETLKPSLPSREWRFVTRRKSRALPGAYSYTLILQQAQVPVSPVPREITLLPFAALPDLSRCGSESGAKVFTVTTKADVDALEEFAARWAAGHEGLDLLMANDFTLQDSCRWAKEPCPGLQLYKLQVNAQGRCQPCPCGDFIGKLGEPLEVMQSRIKAHYQEEIKLRGCRNCPVRQACCKCPYPYPLDREAYCAMRRAHPELGMIIKLWRNLKSFKFNKAMRKMWQYE